MYIWQMQFGNDITIVGRTWEEYFNFIQKIADYTELLFPDNLLREGSVIEQMIALIPEEDWKDQVQIIGFDDIFLSTLLTPELTTITQPIKAIGTKAAELIIHSDGQEMNMEKYIFPVSLVERETTKRVLK